MNAIISYLQDFALGFAPYGIFTGGWLCWEWYKEKRRDNDDY